MKNSLFFIFLFLFGFLKSQSFIDEPYYTIGNDEMSILIPSNDTIYEHSLLSIRLPQKKEGLNKHFKILKNEKIDSTDNVYALKTERLDTIPLTTEPYPEDRFSIFIYKKRPDEIVFLNEKNNLTKAEIMNYKTDTIAYKNNFGFTSYSQTKVEGFSKMKRVETQADSDLIVGMLEKPEYLAMIMDYKKNLKLGDMYASGLMATLLVKACLENGFSPLGAGRVINILHSPRYSEEEKKKKIEIVYLWLYSEKE